MYYLDVELGANTVYLFIIEIRFNNIRICFEDVLENSISYS